MGSRPERTKAGGKRRPRGARAEALSTGGTPFSGDDLRRWRQAHALTQSGLAVRLGVVANTIAKWEAGVQRISQPELVRLALMGLEPDLMVGA